MPNRSLSWLPVSETRDRRWCGDITCLLLARGWLYLATVIDFASRRLIGWSINTHLRTSLITDALDAAVAARGVQVAGLAFHSAAPNTPVASSPEPANHHRIRR